MTIEDDKKHHILVADDENSLADILSDMLKSEGFPNVHTAYDGQEALEVLDRFRKEIYLILLNYTMPGMTGFEVMHQLGMKVNDPTVGIIMITGREDLSVEFYRQGTVNVIAGDFISKPFDIEKVLESVHKLMKRINALRGHNHTSR